MDVEPHSLAEWTSDPDGTSNQFIDMYGKIAGALKGSGIGISACIPRWFDGRTVPRDNRTRPLSDLLADAANRLTLMDYVDKATSIIAEEGEAVMNAALAQTLDAYKSHAGFFGVAVHHRGTYPAMKP